MRKQQASASSQIVVWLLAANLALLLVQLLVPFNSDLDIYHSMGLELTRGRLPYIGSWDNNFPGVVYLHALSIAIFGKGYIGFRIIDILFHLGTVLLLFRIGSKFMPPIFAAVGATLNTLYYISGAFWEAGQKDGFAVFFIALSILVWLENDNKPWRMVWAGASMGYAIAFRPTYAVFALIVIGMEIAETKKLRPSAEFVLGVSIVWLFILGPYLFIRGGLYQFFASTLVLNLKVYGPIRQPYSILGLLRHPLVDFALLSLIPNRGEGKPHNRKGTILALLCLAGSWIGIAMMGKYLVYHFDPFFAVICMIGACGLAKVVEILPMRRIGYLIGGVLLLFFARAYYPFNLVHHLITSYRETPNRLLERTWEQVKDGSDFGLREELRDADYVERTTNPRDKIEVCSIMPALRWRIDRDEASRFTTAHAYGMRVANTDFIPFELENRIELANSLRSATPKLILLATQPAAMEMLGGVSPEKAVFSISGVKELLDSEYNLDTTLGTYDIYRRKR